MYEYRIHQVVNGEFQEMSLYSSQHYTQVKLTKLVKQVIAELQEVGVVFTAKNKLQKISNELINNYDFISCTPLRISVDVSLLEANKEEKR